MDADREVLTPEPKTSTTRPSNMRTPFSQTTSMNSVIHASVLSGKANLRMG